MDNVLNVANVIGGADGPTAVFVAGEVNTGVMIAAVVIGLLFCFFGLKVIKVISALIGFSLGAGIGVAISSVADITGMTSIIIIFVCAVALAALAFFLHRVGVFFLTFMAVCGALLAVIDIGENMQVFIALGAALIVGILAMIFVEPGTIIVTSVVGGFSAGMNISALAGLDDNQFIGFGIAAALAIIGMIVQFMLHSRKVGKKEKMHARKFREKDSMESEVEKARMLLDDDEDEEQEQKNSGKQFDDIEILDDLDDIDDIED